jgi:hypothetical protein
MFTLNFELAKSLNPALTFLSSMMAHLKHKLRFQRFATTGMQAS